MKAHRVLVVEDEALLAILLSEVLTSMGHAICAIVGTEAGAIAAAAEWSPDLMIVDSRLGRGSGVAAVEQILRVGRVPHVFMSGDAPRVLAQRPGATVIQKPFLEADLAQAVQDALAAG